MTAVRFAAPMRIYCKRHRTLLSPQPSSYWPTSEWRCPAEVRERITLSHLMGSGIHPADPSIAGVVVTTRGDTTRLIAMPTLEALRGR